MKNIKLEIPEHLWKPFLELLDFSQSQFTEENIKEFSKEEQELIKFVDDLLQGNKSYRYQTNKEKMEAYVGIAGLAGL